MFCFFGVENDLVLVSGSELTWILCYDVRSNFSNICGVLTDRCVGYVLKNHSIAVDSVAQRFILINDVRASNSMQG